MIFMHFCFTEHTYILKKLIVDKMLNRLQKKWKVNAAQFILIICTFAIGGSITGYAGRKLMNLFEIEKGWLWVLIYLLVICLFWPLAVLLISIPFGQFNFFRKYIGKIGRRVGIGSSHQLGGSGQQPVTHIAIFASGAGSNAQKIIDHFHNHSLIKVSLIVSNKADAGVLKIAEKENIPTLIIDKEKFFRSDAYIKELKDRSIGFIVLAGFLWKIPVPLIKAYPGKIINIHPALLPKYGGKGLYGHFVHEAVLSNKEKESGISIHYVDEIYDHGKIIFQHSCTVSEHDTAESLAQRIHTLEYKYYPKIIEETVNKISH